MIPNLGFIDLDDLAHRLLITHRLLLFLEEAVNPESAKDFCTYPKINYERLRNGKGSKAAFLPTVRRQELGQWYQTSTVNKRAPCP
jgi:hypothetical protein